MTTLRNFSRIVVLQTLAITVLGVVATFLCSRHGLEADMPTGIIGIAIIFPIIYAPYFAYLISDSTPLVGYGVAVLYALVLVSLDNIQEALEDPFDSFGADSDDIDLEISESYTGVL